MPELTPVVPVRYSHGTVRETARTVHLISAPGAEPTAVSALCGALLNVQEMEIVGVGQGMPCDACLLNHAINTPAEPRTGSANDTDSADQVDETSYEEWDWPVTRHGDQVLLDLDSNTSAIAIPAELSIEVTQILTAGRCAPPVLTHPSMPQHHVILTGSASESHCAGRRTCVS